MLFRSVALKYQANLQLVRLYIDTPTFDKITKDQSSKLEDRISTIGGNLGLLTGLKINIESNFDSFNSAIDRFLSDILGRVGLCCYQDHFWSCQVQNYPE